ncbi:hypothetical protein CTI12_AA333180 [Artemisia annua]|uniref:Uncharacterized protein n=1 Tax=Artemisia annua TaxID=35608 RepID=A0A2U1MW37_ARTAN|nr:hypothetical protein CTI12_AA333180 [Artemisia annua]
MKHMMTPYNQEMMLSMMIHPLNLLNYRNAYQTISVTVDISHQPIWDLTGGVNIRGNTMHDIAGSDNDHTEESLAACEGARVVFHIAEADSSINNYRLQMNG